MIKFTKRNLMLYFRDKTSVVFSLMAALITFLLYIAVFRNLYGTGMLFGIGDIRSLTDIWAISGVLAAPTVTVPLGSLWVLVDDRRQKHYKDFYSPPVARWKITGGYLLSAFVVGIIMTCALLVVTQIYLLINGGSLFTLKQYILILGVIVIATFSGAGLTLFLAGLFKNNNAYTACSLVLGTLMGFLSGNYLPNGFLPEPVHMVVKMCPVAHATALLRQIVIKEPMEEMLQVFPDQMSYFSTFMGVEFQYGSYIAEPWVHVAVLVGSGVVFYALAILVLSRKRRK